VESAPREKFQVFPSPPARIKDVVGGVFDATNKELETIYGKVKRVLLVAVIIAKKYTPAGQSDGEKPKKSLLNLTLDDGTGIIQGTWFGVDEDTVDEYDIGDSVMLTARIGAYENKINIIIDGIKKISNLNDELHHRAQILKKLQALEHAGKPLVLPNGGRIDKENDEAARFFEGKGKGEENIEAIEKPVIVAESKEEKLQFTSKLAEQQVDSSENGAEGGIEAEAGDDSGDEQELGNDDDLVKDTIMATIMQPEYADGMTVDQLQEATELDSKVIARVLKIMVNEKTLTKIKSKPDTYRAK